jgi:hypothetical protein
MSRNGHFALHGSLATAYAPDAERSAEGDILGVSAYDLRGLREDDASLRLGVSAYDRMGVSAYDRMGVSAYDLRGLREDDASLRMGDTEFDGATSSAEGSAEGHSVKQLGGILVSNGRVGGITEDHWGTRMGVSAYDLRGLREDDASLRMGVSAYDLRGLREDDASLRMGTAYIDDASGSAEDPRGRAGMGGRGPARGRHLNPSYGTEYSSGYGTEYGGRRYKGSGYMRGLREDDASLRMGDVDDMGAEAWAIEQKGKPISRKTTELRMGMILRGLREDDASLRMGVSAYDLKGLREDDSNLRMGVSAYDMGRRRAFTYGIHGAEEYPPQMLNATGFHERFPVSFQIRGLGLVRMGSTWDEALPRLTVAIQQESNLMDRINNLPPQAKASIMSQVGILNNQGYGQLFNGQLGVYLSDGQPGWDAHQGREKRLAATETMIPTVDHMITAMEGGASPSQATNSAINALNQKINALSTGPDVMSYALPIGGGLLAAGLLTTLVVSLSK